MNILTNLLSYLPGRQIGTEISAPILVPANSTVPSTPYVDHAAEARLRDMVSGFSPNNRYSRDQVLAILQQAAAEKMRTSIRSIEKSGTEGMGDNRMPSSMDAMTPAQYGDNLIGMAHLLGVSLEDIETVLRRQNPDPDELLEAASSVGGELSVSMKSAIFFRRYEKIAAQFKRALEESIGKPFQLDEFGEFNLDPEDDTPPTGHLREVLGKSWFWTNYGQSEILIKKFRHRTNRNSYETPYNYLHISIHSSRALMAVKDLIPKLRNSYPDIKFEVKLCFDPGMN